MTTEKTMAALLEELDKHRPDRREYEGGWWELACAGCDFAKGQHLSHLDWAPYRAHRTEVFAAALSAAGFGLVADAKREALEDAAEECAKTSSNILNNNHNLNVAWDGMAEGWKNAAVRFRARAAEMRQG